MSAMSSHTMRRLTAVSAALMLLSLTVPAAAADSQPTLDGTVGHTSAAQVSALLLIFPAHKSAAACTAVNRSRSTAPWAVAGDRNAPAEPARHTMAAPNGNMRRRPMGFSS